MRLMSARLNVNGRQRDETSARELNDANTDGADEYENSIGVA